MRGVWANSRKERCWQIALIGVSSLVAPTKAIHERPQLARFFFSQINADYEDCYYIRLKYALPFIYCHKALTSLFSLTFIVAYYNMLTESNKNSGKASKFQTEVEPGRVLTMPTDGTGVAVLDPWLEPFTGALRHRYALYQKYKKMIEESGGGYENFTKGYEYFGFHVQKDNSVLYREWAPNATGASLIGEFSELSDKV
jgi:Carbohydrate-binding module 48 (Isoamylase N-terminal domain)